MMQGDTTCATHTISFKNNFGVCNLSKSPPHWGETIMANEKLLQSDVVERRELKQKFEKILHFSSFVAQFESSTFILFCFYPLAPPFYSSWGLGGWSNFQRYFYSIFHHRFLSLNYCLVPLSFRNENTVVCWAYQKLPNSWTPFVLLFHS